MTFIMLTGPRGGTRWVNPAHVTHFYRDRDWTQLWFVDGHVLHVTESATKVAKLLKLD